MRLRLRSTVAFFAFAGLVCAGSSGLAGEKDVKAVEVLEAAGQALAAHSTFDVRVEALYQVTVDGQVESLTTDYDIVLQRPDALNLHVNNREIDIQFIAADGELTTYIPEFDQYTVEAFTEVPGAVIQQTGFGAVRLAMPAIAELVQETPFEVAIGSEAAIHYIGTEEIDGVETDRVRINDDGSIYDIWVTRTAEPLVHKIVPDTTAIEDEISAQGTTAEVEVVATFKRWEFEAINDDAFAFDPPEGTTKVAAFSPPRPPVPADALLGEQAPEFEIALLDGGNLNIASKKNQEIVILDFWATWCGPCRQAMPIINAVSKEFQEKGVRLYAVNIQEEPGQIRGFLESTGLDVTVALDTDSSVSDKFLVQGIPQTVIVGKDGTVQSVHVGMGPALQEELTQELTTLARGEKLVE